jgi:hypothetical protein
MLPSLLKIQAEKPNIFTGIAKFDISSLTLPLLRAAFSYIWISGRNPINRGALKQKQRQFSSCSNLCFLKARDLG